MAKKSRSGFQSAAGLVRYFEEEKTGLKIDPRVIVIVSILTVVVVSLFKIFFPL
ncbi:MAG: preprotein translocase subunit Sec61beta [Thermoplasmatales archaeon]|nr:preprotein translocase subunit Sec61beta [Thermoplasmatales archaeon]